MRIAASIEAEIAQLSDEEQLEFLADLSVNLGLNRLIREGYGLWNSLLILLLGQKSKYLHGLSPKEQKHHKPLVLFILTLKKVSFVLKQFHMVIMLNIMVKMVPKKLERTVLKEKNILFLMVMSCISDMQAKAFL